jgi:hypothetical protein
VASPPIRSGTEEDYSELSQLLEDIVTYKEDIQNARIKEKEAKMQKEEENREQALQMHEAALCGMSSKI